MQTTLFEVSESAPGHCFKNPTTDTQSTSRFGDNFLHEQMSKSKAVAICDIKPYARALRKHPERQITQ